MIPQIKEINFPEYATLSQATVTIADMGDRSIETQIKIDGSIAPDFSYDWEVSFRGERYIHPVREPQASKDTSSRSSVIDMTFQHWAIYQMKREFFVELASVESGTAIADKYIASLSVNLGDFVTAFGNVLRYYFGDTIRVDLNPEWDYSKEVSLVSISYSYIWDVLQKLYEIYKVRWTLATNEDGSYTVRIGYPTEEVTHIFEYGYKGGLLKFSRQVQSTDIRNVLLGRGGDKNLPAYYFKNAPEGSLFASDPDAIPELENIYFSELRGKTFRDYVKGWKAKHYNGDPMAEPTEAYTAGYTDEKFDPIEYVEDKESIAKYGILKGGLDNNEEIYPSIQGVVIDGIGRVDEVVAVEEVLTDDVEGTSEEESVVTNVQSAFLYDAIRGKSREEKQVKGYRFTVEPGKTAILSYKAFCNQMKAINGVYTPGFEAVSIESSRIEVYSYPEGVKVETETIPEGDYTYRAVLMIKNDSDYGYNISTGVSEVKLISSTLKDDSWKKTFDIWIKNIWQTEKGAGESDIAYANRVWGPILGDGESEAMVVFSSGWLSGHEDYDFPIVGFAYDNTREIDGVKSEWRLTLGKTDAELEATGLWLPNTRLNAKAGDFFYFTGIELPHQYVLWAEERLDTYKRDQLLETAEINPSWEVSFDNVRIETLEGEEKEYLSSFLNVGAMLRVTDPRFVEGAYLQLYLQSITYTWSEGQTTSYPSVEVVLSDKVSTVENPVDTINSEIDSLQAQIGGLSNIQQIIRAVCDVLYLRKDGVSDRSISPTTFASLISGMGFIQGLVGGAGWGIYRDGNGKSVAEFDKVLAREELQVNSLVSYQTEVVGGILYMTAAKMQVMNVEELESGYKCYFDEKNATVANLFKVDDIAYSQTFNPEKQETGHYLKVVTEVGRDYIVLSKTDSDGDEAPAIGDIIIQRGNKSDKSRQSFIIINPLDGGSVTVYAGVNSFSLEDRNYVGFGVNPDTHKAYIYGYGDGYLGSRDTQAEDSNYVTFQNDQLFVKGNVTIGPGSSGLGNLSDWKEWEDKINNMEMSASGYILDLTNENASVSATADGVVTGPLPVSEIRIYYGSVDDTAGWEFTLQVTGCDGEISGNVLTITELTADTATATVQATKEGKPTLKAVMTITKVRAGKDGQDGEPGTPGGDGAPGVGISSVDEYYLVSDKDSGITTATEGWTKEVQKVTPEKRYLWNREIIWYTNGSTTKTEPVIIGVYGETGSAGVGIKSVTEYYLASADKSGVTTETQGWTTEVQTTTSEKRYLWNYEVIEYTDGSSKTLSPVIIGTYGDTGDAGQDAVIYYLLPSADKIVKSIDGTIVPESITCEKYRQKGNESAVVDTTPEIKVKYQRIGTDDTEKDYSGAVAVGKDTTAVVFSLYNGATMLDRERIPVLTDASDLVVGGENLLKGTAYRDMSGVVTTPDSTHSAIPGESGEMKIKTYNTRAEGYGDNGDVSGFTLYTLVTDKESVTVEDSFTTGSSVISAAKPYCYAYIAVTYGSASGKSQPFLLARYIEGRGAVSRTNTYFGASESADTEPSWQSSKPSISAQTPYLWIKFTTIYANGESEDSIQCIACYKSECFRQLCWAAFDPNPLILSFYARAESTPAKIWVRLNGVSSLSEGSLVREVSLTSQWERYTIYWGKILSTNTDKASVEICSSINGSIHVKRMMLEYGNVPTDWKESQNDLSQQISDLEYLKETFGYVVDVDGAVLSKMAAVKDDSGKIVAMLNGSDEGKDAEHGKLMLATGMDGIQNAAEARSRMYEDGYFITSSIDVREGGKIGGFTATNKDSFVSLSYEDSENNKSTYWTNNEFYLGNRLIEYDNHRQFKVSNSMQYTPVADIISTVASVRDRENTALKVSASGVQNTNLQYTNVGNFAILCEKGMFAGFRPVTRQITTSQTLSVLDHTLIVQKSATLTLPSSPENGQHYEFIKEANVTLTLKSATKDIWSVGVGQGLTQTFGSGTTVHAFITYYADKNVWALTYFVNGN